HRTLPPFHRDMAHGFDPIAGFKNAFVIGFPVLTGARWPFSREDLAPWLSPGLVALYVAAALCYLAALVRDRTPFGNPKWLAVPLFAFNLVIFAFSQFHDFADEPRYLLALGVGLPLTLAWFCAVLWRRAKTAAAAAVLLATALSAFGSVTLPPQI